MKFYSDNKVFELHNDLKKALKSVREARSFDVDGYIAKKVDMLNAYMRRYKLKSCVVAISGGIDSAVVYALISEAKKTKDSPIQKVVPIFLPVYNSAGATNQEEAKKKAEDLINVFGGELKEVDISPVHQLLKSIVDRALDVEGQPWASGQLVSYLRTPAYYYVSSLLNQQGYPPIVCGTTNRDEGAYLGYFGKASDGMVDIQLISDIHKSEVYQVAKHLDVPQSIIKATPTGDMYDNRSDEELFGATYDFVELYLHYLNMEASKQFEFCLNLSEEANEQFLLLKKNIDDLHHYNHHKYLGASPAVHMDVIEGKVKGGWIYNNFQGEI
ncbi:NAD(+) synthase (plasmid) [Paenibacillus thiaminolyticus]|uniref:NAD(+) synthase n=1 Tax=Paenibacillus thiaminolyticus TaxID=49283 RepID=UPI00232B079B|nr:NAD(+) synthase [Paenibacillus thiaminolyticus]WCF11612.1 NAD(+) synthase [Paenibacillus thiaminolyticus]